MKNILIIALLCVNGTLIAQNLNMKFQWINSKSTPPQVVDADSEHVSSDFGRREFASKFHDGVDFTGAGDDLDLGFKLKAINGGRIKHIVAGAGVNYNIITIDGPTDFGYGHIFRVSTKIVDNFSLVEWEVKGAHVIVCGDEGYALTDAWLQSTDVFMGYSVADGTLKNTVEQGDVIAPMGDSGSSLGDDAFPVHVHLYGYKDLSDLTGVEIRDNENLMDPLYWLDYSSPDYDVTIEAVKHNEAGYYTNPSFQVRCDWSDFKGSLRVNDKYNGAIMDLNSVELQIKKKHENNSKYTPIEGAYYQARLCDGANLIGPDKDAYPTLGRPASNNDENGVIDIRGSKTVSATSAGFGDYKKTGIVGCAYKTTGTLQNVEYLKDTYPDWTNNSEDAWDDYFFNDFPTRIAKQSSNIITYDRDDAVMANHISEARYSDGIYQVKAVAKKNQRSYSLFNTSSFNSDPEEIVIDNFRPYVKSVILRSLVVDGQDVSYYPSDQNGELIYRSEWTWNGSSLEITPNNERQYRATGVSEKLWLEIEFSEPIHNPADIFDFGPYLSLNNTPVTFVRYDEDFKKIYYELDPIDPSSSTQLSFDAKDLSMNSLQTDPSIISIKKYTPSKGVYWDPQAVPGDDENHTFNSGTYCNIPVGNQSPGTANRIASVANSSASCVLAGFVANNRIPSPYEPVVFSAFVLGDNYEYRWDFGEHAVPETLTTYEPEVTVIYSEEGNKDVSLTMVNLSTSEETVVTESSFIGVGASVVPLTVDFTSVSSVGVNNNITFQANATGGDGNLQYYWDFGKGANVVSNSGEIATVNYNSQGPKTVQLTVSDNNQSKTETKFNHVNVNGYASKIRISSINVSKGLNFNNIRCTAHVLEGDWVREGGVSNNTYFWDFGDGSYSTEMVAVHTYNAPGLYTVTLTVCDLSGCSDKSSSVVDMDPSWFPLDEEDEPEIIISGKESWTTSEHIKHFRPFKLTTILPDELDSDDVKFEINYTDYSNIQRNLATYTGVGPHTLVHNASYKRYGISLKYYVASTGKYESADYLDVYPGGGPDDLGPDYGDYFGTSVSNMRLSTYCYDEDERPRLLFDRSSPDNGDELLFTCQVFQDGEEIDSYLLYPGRDYEMSRLKKSIFPVSLKFTAEWIRYDVGKDDYGDEKIEPIGVFETVIYGLEEIEMPESYTMCSGATQIIGVVNPSDKFDYQWSVAGGTSDLYLSDPRSPNPEFSGVVDGSYTYNLTMTNKESGCSDHKQVQILVGDTIDVFSYNYGSLNGESIKAGSENRTLVAPVHSGASDYDFEWSPSDFLDNPFSATPTFLTPRYGIGTEYQVTIRHRGCSEAVATVFVGVSNPPPSLDNLEIFEDGSFGLDWRANGIASEYIIERKEEGSSDWQILGRTNKVTAFSDMDCIDPTKEYCYRILAYDINGDFMGYSDEECGQLPYILYSVWSQDISNLDHYHTTRFINDVEVFTDGKLVTNGSDELYFATVVDGSQSYKNLAVMDLDVESGTIKSTVTRAEPGVGGYGFNSLQDATLIGENEIMLTAIEGNSRLIKMYQYDGSSIGRYAGTQNIALGSSSIAKTSVVMDRKLELGIPTTYSGDLDVFFSTEFGTYYSHVDLWGDGSNQSEPHQLSGAGSTVYKVLNDHFDHSIVPVKENDSNGILEISQLYHSINFAFSEHFKIGTELPIGTTKLRNIISYPLGDGTNLIFASLESTIGDDQKYFYGRITLGERYDDPPKFPFLDNTKKRVYEGGGGDSELLSVIPYYTLDQNLNDARFLMVGRSEAQIGNDKTASVSDNDVWIVCIDGHGNKKWDAVFDYEYVDTIFDAVGLDNGDLVLAAMKDKANGIANIQRISFEKYFEPLITICEDVKSDKGRSAQAERIIVGEGCDVEFEKRSHTQLIATKSITFRPGTYVEEKSYFKGEIDENRVENCDLLIPFIIPNVLNEKLLSEGNNNVLNEKGAILSGIDKVITVFPNPTAESFSVDLTEFESQEYKISIYQIDGQFTGVETSGYYSGKSVNLNVSNLPSGIYYMNIELKKSGLHKGKVMVHK